jgi:TolA-binding protein
MEYKLRQLEDGQRRMKGDVEFRLNALENPGGAAAATPGEAAVPTPGTPAPAAAAPAPVAQTPPARPATADAAWAVAYPKVTARDWPAVESQMTKFVADWPKSPRVAQAKYWIGRSHAARNQQPQAAQAFLEVYQSAPRSAPAPDALIGLAGALNAMAKTENACQVLGELQSVYGAKLTETQKADAARQRTRAKCAA